MAASAECVFCRIARAEIPAAKVYEDEHVLAFRDLNPAAPVHMLVVPKAHAERLDAYGPDDALLLGRVMLGANAAARAAGLADFRAVVNCGPGAQQTVRHLHVHVLGGRDFTWPPG